MKALYILLFGIFLCIAFIRFSYGFEPLRFSEFLAIIKDFPLDIQEDLKDVLSSVDKISKVIEEFRELVANSALSWSKNPLTYLARIVVAIFNLIRGICMLLVQVVIFLGKVLYDFSVMLRKLFALLFGISVDPSIEEEFGDFGGGGYGGGGGGVRP